MSQINSFCYMLVSLLVMPLINPSSVFAQKQTDDFLVAFSLRSAKKALETGSGESDIAKNLARITTPKAIVIDDAEDLILVGIREDSLEALTLDDLAIGLRNLDDLGTAQSPGVSIEPERRKNGDFKQGTDWMNVRFTGEGIEDTRIGQVFFQADLLLKLLNFGYEPLGIHGVPTEWDLDIHQLKVGRRIEPWTQEPAPSYFFPTHVKVVTGNQSAYLHSIRISVISEEMNLFQRELRQLKIPRSIIEKLEPLGRVLFADTLNSSELETEIAALLTVEELASYRKKIFKAAKQTKRHARRGKVRNPEEADKYLENGTTPSLAFAAIMTEHYGEIERRYPVLQSYKNFTILLALLQAADQLKFGQDLQEWLGDYRVAYMETPRRIPTVRRGIDGLAVSLRVAGGIAVHPLVYRARAGSPSAIRELVLRYRPSEDAVAWIVPIGEIASPDPDTATIAGLEGLLREEPGAMKAGEATEANIFLDDRWLGWEDRHYPRPPLDTPGWNPRSSGLNLFEVVGQLDYGAGDTTLVRPDQLYIEPPSEIASLSYQFTARWVLRNRFEFGATVPFKFKFFQAPASRTLPGIVDYGYVAGLSNVNLFSRYLLRKGLWNRPSLVLDGYVVTPLSFEILEDTPGEESRARSWPSSAPAQEVPIGLDGWSLYLGAGSTIPIGNRLKGRVALRVNLSDYEDQLGVTRKETNYLITVEPLVFIQKKWAAALGVSLTYIMKEQDDVMRVEFFFDTPSRNRMVRSSSGITLLENDELYYFYNIAFAPEFLFFRRARWSD